MYKIERLVKWEGEPRIIKQRIVLTDYHSRLWKSLVEGIQFLDLESIENYSYVLRRIDANGQDA